MDQIFVEYIQKNPNIDLKSHFDIDVNYDFKYKFYKANKQIFIRHK